MSKKGKKCIFLKGKRIVNRNIWQKNKQNLILTIVSFAKIPFVMGILFIFSILLLINFFTMPHMSIIGKSNIVIEYGSKYQDEGVTATYLNNNVSNDVLVTNNININKIGVYKIIYQLKKDFRTIRKTRLVTVVDKKLPTITLIGNNEIHICPNLEYTEKGYTATDEYDGDLTNQVKITKKDALITYNVKDSSGNEFKIDRTIIKEDKEAPLITLNGKTTIYVKEKTSYNEPGYKVIDNCEGDISNKLVIEGTVDHSKVGTYTLTYRVKDSLGNEASMQRKVIVYKPTVYPTNGTGGTIYLTFDDGPLWGTTNVILDILKAEGIKATFFVTNNGPDSLISREYNEGHSVGLHTATHKYSIYTCVNTYFADLSIVEARVQRITGESSKILRFPGGSSNTVSRNYNIGIMTILTQEVINRGYHYYDWNVSGEDSSTCTTSSCVYSSVLKSLSKSRINIVLLHDTKYITASALTNIINYGKANGYQFAKITYSTPMYRTRIYN